MRPTLRAVSARLIVGHLDPGDAGDLLATIDVRGRPLAFALAEPDGLRLAAPVAAGIGVDRNGPEPLRWGKLVLETVANETLASARRDLCDTIVDGLRTAHRRLGLEGLDLIPRGSSGVGFCAAALVDGGVQLVIVPPSQVFVVHQGVALSISQSGEAGRGIWMRDDLRAEIFAGIGGAHEPDISVYDAAIGPGDSLVLTSSSLARMLTEEDVRQAVAYEEAAVGAERLKQLAIQRGVEAGAALVVEIAGSFEPPAPTDVSGPIVVGGIQRPTIKLEMPPIGSIFSTARDWLLEAVDRVQAGQPPEAPAQKPAEIEEIPVFWPKRPAPGAWRKDFEAAKRIGFRPAQAASSSIETPSPAAAPVRRGEGATPPSAPAGGDYAALSSGWRRESEAESQRPALQLPDFSRLTSAAANLELGQAVQRVQAGLSAVAGAAGQRIGQVDLGRRRQLLVPALALLCALLVVFGIVRTIKGQQARQVQQRYDSLISAATQLETQARNDGDRNEAQGLIRRAQALVDQAGNIQPNRPQVASLRKDLQGDLDRLDNVLSLPNPTTVANFGGAGKDVAAGQIVADASGVYALDTGGQRVLQATPQGKQVAAIAAKGDKSGANQLGTPRLISLRDAGPLILDSNRNLWAYSAANKTIQQIGLKSADTWKDPTAMAAYGPNLYVLDAGLGNVFRYASRDGIFTDAPTRFFEKDNPDLLKQAVSLAIDGSIWVLNGDGQIFKLENAARQPFTVTGLPQPIGKASQIATQAGYRSLYVLDVGNNRVVEIAKDGRYLRQFNLNLPAPATGFWPDETAHQLLVAAGNTLYHFELPAS
jgi:hypothetical protein